MIRCFKLLSFAAALLTAFAARAQNLVFNDGFSSDSLSPGTYPTVSSTSTGWQVLASKSPSAPTKTASSITINMVSTSSGFIEAEALFAPAAIQLLPGTYIELQATFVPTAILTVSADTLNVGLFNSGGTAPIAGLTASGLSSGLTTFATGGAKGWKGYNTYFVQSGTPVMRTRDAQTGANNTVQDVLFDGQSGSVGYSAPAAVSASGISAGAATLTTGNTYTLDYKLSLSSDGATVTAANSLYNGTGTTNTGTNTRVMSYSGTFAGSSVMTKSFDAFAIGWRADSSTVGAMVISGLTVRTTGGAPWFTTLPAANIAVTIGDNLNLNVVAAGSPTGYQWQFSSDSGVTYSDMDTSANTSAATTSLTLTNVQNSSAGMYRLKATNSAGSSLSRATTVTVSATPVAPTISIDPVSATVLGGASTTLSATVNGTSPLTYQWQFSTDGATYNPISGANTASFVIPAIQLSDEGYYRLYVSNVAGNATSGAAFLTVNQPLTINTQPVGATLNIGDSYTLSVGAVGRPAPQYQWSLNGNAISGATSASYVISSAAVANAGLYTVNVTNTAGDSVTSSGAGVAVLSTTMATTAMTPAGGASGLNRDTPLTLTFNQAVSVGVFGTIKIFDASNPTTPIDTIDLVAATVAMKTLRNSGTLSTQALPVQSKTIGTVTNFNYYPITVSGTTATIYPRNGAIAYGKTYYVTIDPGVFTDSTGLSYGGITSTSAWTFSTKATGPWTGTNRLVVAADGSGDFCTVQGALDWIPAANTNPTTIFIKNGTYFEQVYFTGKHSLTFVGESRSGVVIAYPNNNTFNNASGVYHRMVFNGDHANNVALMNLTIQNTTPKGGTQAEALILNGSTTAKAIISNVDLLSYQDTLQINGQAYVTNSHISGDVDFLWGSGPCFFENCELTALTMGGYFTQIRNGNTGHGYVFLNCTLDAASTVTGMFLARIDPTTSQFPYSEVVYLNCVMGSVSGSTYTTPVSNLGWLLNNTADQTVASAPNVHFWEYNSHYSDGTALNVASRIGASKQLTLANDAATITNYSTYSYVLGNGWTPQLAPVLATQPLAQTLSAGAALTLSVQAFGVPAVSYQWQRNGVALTGATNATYTVSSAASADAGTYAVVMTNAGGTTTSSTVSVAVTGAAPVITLQPAATSALLGTTVNFDAVALGDTPITYQWSKDGTAITGATNQSLRLTALAAGSAGNYSVAITNGGGTTTSAAAALTLVTPANTLPTQPLIPAGNFNVNTYGAVGDGTTDNTTAIQAALTAASNAGGGTVEISPASQPYLCGPITVPSNTNFQIDGGAILKALPYGRYPNSTSVPAHFITIPSGATNIEFSGTGTIEGGGADWWAVFNANSNANRPRMVQITKATKLLFSGLTLRNSPMFHLAFSGANNNVTIYNVTISAPGDSPNTDGMDVAGTNFLIQGCTVGVGDDNIVAKPGSVFCSNLYISNCTFGTGHGLSVGGQTNVGLDGMTVTNCTFNGTDTGLRLKADATQGGVVQNLTYSNLTMTNVTYPIVFYSYYNQIGSPGAVSGSSQTTAAKVNSYNSAPPNSLAATTIPTWQNITLSNITATGASGYSILWGIPLANALISGVTFNNVNISGGAGLELYDANNVQFTGTNTVGTILTTNALAITQQPQAAAVNVADSVTFTAAAVGSGGQTSAAPTFMWALNGTVLTDGLQSDGSTISGSSTTTLTITNVRVTKAGNYTFIASENLDGYNVATSSLGANSLPVSATSSAAALTVTPLPASVSLSNLSYSYTGLAYAPTATTSPAGLPVSFTYSGSTKTPTASGTYTVVATVSDPNYSGTTTATMTIGQNSGASIDFSGLSATYDGNPHPVTALTNPRGIPFSLAYAGGTVPINAGSYVVTGVFADSNYSGSFSATLVIAKANQTVTFPSVGSVDVNTAVTLAATANSGLPITYSVVSGAATLSGSTLTPTAGGTVTVRATQAGNANYNAATTDLPITVTSRQSQTITFAAVGSHLTNDAPIALSASASSGLPVTLAVISGPAILSGSTLTLTGAAGTVTVRASQAGDTTYLPAPNVDRTFDVADASTDTYFGDLVPGATAQSIDGHAVAAAVAKAGDVAAAITAGTKQGNLLIVAPSLNLNVALPISIGADGTYSVAFTSAGQSLTLTGSLANGVLTGQIAALNVSFATPVQVRSGTTAALVGFYSASALATAQGQTYSIVGSSGQALVLTVTGSTATGGVASVSSTGVFTLSPSAGVTITGSVNAATAAMNTTLVVGGQTTTFSGVKDQVVRTDRLVNLSSRGRVSGGERIVISGFVVGGGAAKQVLIRAIGPGLTAFGVAGTLPSPRLQLISNGNVMLENSGWGTAPNAADIATTTQRVGAFALAAGSADSAILTTLQPGAYTAQVSNGTTAGVTLVEIYDCSVNPQGEYQRLTNISTRGDVGAGENILIGGFVVTGNSPKKLLVRGVGPSLSQFGVLSALSDPKLRVYQGYTLLGENDNWGTGDGSAAADVVSATAKTGGFPLQSGTKDAVLLLTLPPGSYTAQVSGVNNATGIALIEVYELP